MKEYLLKPHKRIKILQNNDGEINLMRGFNGLRGLAPLIKDKIYMFVHFKYDEHQLIKSMNMESREDSSSMEDNDKDND